MIRRERKPRDPAGSKQRARDEAARIGKNGTQLRLPCAVRNTRRGGEPRGGPK